LGRSSVDIIKSGGYKISALDIESALLHHPSVAEAAVLGVADDKLGQVVTALIYPKEQQQAALADGSSNSSNDGNAEAEEVLIQELKQLCRTELAQYSVPRRWKVLQAPLPRNAMGKVNKKELLKTFFSAEATAAATSL
jgi:malonyl-CoA/methylmalonyl-CoA synthetase